MRNGQLNNGFSIFIQFVKSSMHPKSGLLSDGLSVNRRRRCDGLCVKIDPTIDGLYVKIDLTIDGLSVTINTPDDGCKRRNATINVGCRWLPLSQLLCVLLLCCDGYPDAGGQ